MNVALSERDGVRRGLLCQSCQSQRVLTELSLSCPEKSIQESTFGSDAGNSDFTSKGWRSANR